MQEAFLQALRRPPEDETRLLSWLAILARQEAIRSGIREDHRRERERAVAATEDCSAETTEAREQRGEARRLLESLPDPYRVVLQLRYIEGLEIDEIAQRLGRSRGTVGSQIKRGLDRLRERLVPKGRRRLRGLLLFSLGRDGPPSLRWASRAALLCVGAAVLVPLWRSGVIHGSAAERSTAQSESVFDAGIESPSPVARVASTLPGPMPNASPKPTATTSVVAPGPGAWMTSARGLVLGPDDLPLAGATLRAGKVDEAPGRVVGTSDASGRFQLEGLDGRLWVWADTEGRRASKRHLLATVRPERELVLLTGELLDARRGRVLSPEGVPVAGAKVTFVGGIGNITPDIGDQGTIDKSFAEYRHTVVTAPDGTFPFALGSLRRVLMMVEAPGLPPTLGGFEKDCDQTGTDIYLSRGGTIRGRVFNGETPVPGAQVRLELPAPCPSRVTTADERGEYRFDAVPLVRHELVASDASGRSPSRLTGELKDPTTLSRDIRLSEDGTLRGIFRVDEHPVAGWSVELERMRTDLFPDRRVATTEEGGRFAFDACMPGDEYLLTLRAPGRTSPSWAGRVTAGASPELSLHVRAAEWEPSGLEGVMSAAQPADFPSFVELWSDALLRRWMARVDPLTGRYAFEDVPPGDHVLLAWTERSGAVTVEPVTLEPGRVARLDASLGSPGTLRVRVQLPADVAAERVDIAWFERAMQGNKPYRFRWLPRGPEPLVFLASLPPGELELRVCLDGRMFDLHRVRVRQERVTEELVTIPPLIDVAFRLGLPRRLLEWDDMHVIARGEREWKHSHGRSILESEELPRVLLARDVREIEVRFDSGLRGFWRGSLEALSEPAEIWVPLEEFPAAQR